MQAFKTTTKVQRIAPSSITRSITTPKITTHRLSRSTKPKPTTTTTAAASSAVPVVEAVAQSTTTFMGRYFTGVPLIQLFEAMPAKEATLLGAVLITTASILAYLCTFLLSKVVQLAEKKLSKSINGVQSSSLLLAALVSLQRPVNALVPYLSFTFSLAVGAALLQVTATRMDLGSGIIHRVTLSLLHVAQLLQDTFEVLLLGIAVWFLLAWKNKVVEIILDNCENIGLQSQSLERVLTPMSTLVSWLMYSGGALAAIHIAGFDVRPLLTLGSVGTVAVAFAAQSTVANVVSAIILYVNRPFIEGDMVHLRTASGGSIARGTVQTILPMKTVLIDDDSLPIYISNKDIATGMIIVNETKRGPPKAIRACYVESQMLTIRYVDVDKVPAIQAEGDAYLKSRPEMSKARFNLQGFSMSGAELKIKYILKEDYYSKHHGILADVLIDLERIVRKNGAQLAMDGDVV